MNFPDKGEKAEVLIESMEAMKAKDAKWKEGRCFSYVYYPDEEMSKLLKTAYTSFFSENALNPSAFPSLRQMELEIVSMVADLLNGDEDTCGSLTTGGTESIMMAIKSAREWAKINKPNIKTPEIVLPCSAHPAFQKAFHYFGIKQRLVKVDKDFKADMDDFISKINENTIMLIGSAPAYPHGVMDPIETIASKAKECGVLCHVDACVGGFVLPFLKKLNYDIPPFDFMVEGVTSMSCDIHKYGYTAKGASVILYKNKELRKHQYFVYSDWTGGIYGSPSVTGTRSGGAIAAAWCAIKHKGYSGYMEMTKKTMDVAKRIIDYVENHSDLYIIGSPIMCIFAIGSDKIDIYSLGDELMVKDWFIDKQQFPPSLHLSVNQHHEISVNELLDDLDDCIRKAKAFNLSNLSNQIQVKTVEVLKALLPDAYFKKFKKIAANKSDIGSKRTAAMYGMMGTLRADEDGMDVMVMEFLDKLNSLE